MAPPRPPGSRVSQNHHQQLLDLVSRIIACSLGKPGYQAFRLQYVFVLFFIPQTNPGALARCIYRYRPTIRSSSVQSTYPNSSCIYLGIHACPPVQQFVHVAAEVAPLAQPGDVSAPPMQVHVPATPPRRTLGVFPLAGLELGGEGGEGAADSVKLKNLLVIIWDPEHPVVNSALSQH